MSEPSGALTPAPISDAPPSAELPRHLERLAWLMDQSITVPGTRFKLGLDSLIGLVPGVGDVVGLVISAWIVISAARAGARRPTIVRMIINVIRDSVLGSVPVVGDVFDMVSRANVANIKLLREDLLAQQQSAQQRAWWQRYGLILIASGALLVTGFAIYGAVQLISKLL